MSRNTYCIKYFKLCNFISQYSGYFVEFLYGMSCLARQDIRIIIKCEFLSLICSLQNRRLILTCTVNTDNLRMIRPTNENNLLPRVMCLLHQALNSGHVGTGRVDDTAIHLGESQVDLGCYTMRSDQDDATGFYLLKAVCYLHASGDQIFGDNLIMNQFTVHIEGALSPICLN